MIVALVQLRCELLNIPANLSKHISAIKQSSEQGANTIVFPELSLFGYSLDAQNICRSNEYQEAITILGDLSNELGLSLCVGAPRESIKGLHISQFIFQPDKTLLMHDKGLLHVDEKPFYTEGEVNHVLHFDELSVGLGICYEAVQQKHFLKCMERNPDFYIACVAKTKVDAQNSSELFATWSREMRIPILMVNSVGACDGFEAGGGSAVWNDQGAVRGFLDDKEEAILMYDVNADMCSSHTLKLK